MASSRLSGRLWRALRFSPPELSRPWTYAAAIVFVVLAGLLQHAILPFPSVAPFLFFFLAVTVVSWFGGRGPGLVAALLSAFAGNLFFAMPRHELVFSGQLGRATLLFVPMAGLIALLGGSLREAMFDARAALTAQRRATEAAEASEESRQLAQTAARLGFYEHDLRTGVIKWDERLHEIWGLSETEPISWDRVVSNTHPDDRERLRAVLDPRAAKSDYEFKHRIIRPRDGLERWIRVTGHASWEDGKPVRHVGTVEDITERKREAEALQAANLKLAEADQRKNEFLGMLSHELRNPLTPIRTSLYILQRASQGGEQARRAQLIIDRQMSHLCRLVDDLLDVTRIGRGKIRLQRTRVDVVGLTRRTVEDHRASLEEDHEVAVELPDESLWINGDPTRLAQAIGNLLSNAGKFTPGGGKIAVSLRRAGEQVLLEVADSGIGIDPSTLQNLFQPFAQADRSLDRSRGGLGLGLALVKGIVELHGGEVAVQSEGPGKGARFSLAFPLEEPAGAALGPREPTGAIGPARVVLIIEDNRDAADTLSEALSLAGHRVAAAYDGETGVAKASELRPEVVLCDIGLPPGMDGYAVAQALRKDPRTRSAYLAALTGYAQPEDQRRVLDAGFDVHLAKPPDLAELERLLARVPGRDREPGEQADPR